MTDLRQQEEPSYTDEQSHTYQRPRSNTARNHRDEHRPDDECDHRRRHREARVQRRQPEHQLQVLGDEDVRSEADEGAERVRDE